MRARIRKIRNSLEQGRCRRGFKPDAAVGSTNRSATTSACVGWDIDNIENRLAFRKEVAAGPVENEPHQNGFTTTRITIPIIKTVGTSLIKR